MTEQSDTPPVTPLGFSEWSSENPYDDPLESRLKYGDYLREEYIKARAYNPTVEGQIKEGFTLSLQQEGILSSDGENAEEIEQRISDLEKGSSFDQRARSFYQSLSPNDPDQQSFKDYLQASSVEAPSAEYLEELQPLKEKVESTLNTRQDENFRSQVESGELPIARLSDGEILVGENAEKMGLVSALKASSRANISMRDALSVMPQLETPDGHKLPLYKLKKIVSAVNLLEEEREQNPDFAIQLDGLSTAQAEKEFDTGDKILKTLEAVPRFGRSLLSRIMGQEEAFDKAEQRRKAVEEARGIDHSQLAAKYALKFNMRPEDMEAAMKQIIHDNAMQKQMFKSYDKDDEVGKNLRFGGFGLPSMPLPAMLNKDVYDKTLAAHPNLSPSVKDMLDKQRVNVLKSEFTTMDKFLSSQDSVSEDWNQSLMIGRRAGVPDYKILEGFVADEDNYNVFKERAAGVKASIVNGFLLPFAGVAAAFGLDPAKDYLASVSQKNADRRQLASVFGEDFPFLQDVAETAFPMLMDVAATGLLAVGTAPIGGTGALAYASLKAGGKTSASLAAKGVVKAITSNQFRRQAGKSAFEQAEDLIQKGLVKGSPEGAVQLLKTYNGTLAQKLGIAPAVFIPAATRSGSATYGAVYNQLKQNPDITEEEAHDRSLGAMLMAGTFTGVLTSAFSLIGKGGLEDALLKGLTPKDMRVVARGITGRLDGDLLSSAQKAIKATMKKYAFGGLKGVAKNVVDEGVEEGIDEFVNGMITDVALHEDTPMLERMQQTWHAVALGGVMGGSVPAVQLGLKSIRPAITRSNQMAQFYDDIINEAVADLNANGSPITAKAFQEAVSDMKRKDARADIAPNDLLQLTVEEEPAAEETETPLPSGITSDPQMELALQDKVNPDSVASAIADVMADKASVATNANPATMEIKGALMNRMNMPAGSSSYVENADHQSVRDLISPTPAPPVIEEALPPQRSKILDPRRVGEAGAIEARFGKRVAEINRAKDLYVKMNREASSAEVAGESSVGRALRKRVQEGKAVSPEQAEELIGQAFKDRVKALSNLKIDSDVTLDEVTEAPDEIEAIDNLIASGFRHVITPAKLKRLGIPVNQRTTSDAFIRSANAKIAEGIKSKFLRISYSPLEGDIPMNSAYGDGKIFVNRFGVGMFNNDPLDMLTFLERGIPVVVDKNVRSFIKNQINPSFRFTEFNDKIFVSDIVIPESGGLVSAVTPMDRVLSLQPDYTRLVKLTERVVNLRAKGLADPEGMVTSPFNPDEKISNQDILDRLESNESVAPFLAPSKGELAPEFTEAALLELRLSSMEALFEGADFSGYSSLPSAGRRIADAYVSEQESRLAHQKESFVSTLSVDEVSELEGDPDFNPEVEAEDTYVPPQEEISPPFAPARITAAYKEVQANAVAAMTADSALRRRIVGIVQNEVFQTTNIDFNRTTNKTLWGHLVNWMAQGNAKSNSISLLFQKELRTRQFDMAAPVRDALRLMGLTSNSIEGTPKSDADYLSLIKDTVENIKGEPATDLETLNFFNYVKQSVRTLFLRSQPHNMGKGYVQMLNNDAIAALGLESGNPDSIIEALNRIAGLSQRAQKEYDTHLVSLARLLLQSPNFIKTIELSIDETNQPYAGKFDRLSDGTPAISLNINGHNPRGLADTLLHELIHAYVTNITGKPESARTPQETAAIQTLEATISELKKDYAAMGSEYAIRNVITTPSSRLPNLGVFSFNDSRINDALANVDEFVAHFLTSTDFQQFVKTMTGDRGPAVYSAFQRIIMAIRSFFRGATPRFDAAFSAVLDLSHSSVLEAGARRRKKKDLITVNEFLALPNKKSKQAVDFIEESVFPFTPVSENTIPKEPITPDTVVHTITKGVSTAQQEQADLSSAIQEATGVDATAKKEEGDAYERIVRYLKGAVIPPEVRTEVSETIPQMAKMDNDTGVLTINPKKLNGLMVDLQRRNAGRKVPPETLRGIISVVINEEIAHAASVAAITRTEQQEIIGAMTIADAYKAIDEYGDDSAGAASMREKMKEKWRAGDPTTQIQVMEEMLRQHADRATNGFSTEEDVAFLRTNPSILQYVIRYFQRFLKKLGYYRSRKNISPELNTAINRVVNELRALKLGFRSLSNIKTFDADNPLAVLELLKKQAGMNKSVDQPDEQELAVASGITLTGRDLNLEAVKGAESLGVQERDKFTGLVYTAVDPADLGFTDLISETIEAGEDPMFPAFAVEAREGFTKSFLDAPDQEIKPHVYLRHIVVPNEFRSKGVGRAMLKALLRKMDEAGSDIALFFRSTDRRGIEGKQLYDFYASEGFTEIEDIFIGRMINDPESWIKREFERWKDIRDNQYEDEIEFFSHSGDKIISYSLYDMSDVRLMEVMREYHAAKVAYAYDEGFDLRRPAQPLEQGTLDLGSGIQVSDVWDLKGVTQKIGSQDTSLSQRGALFGRVKNWVAGTVNADIGGGKSELATEYLAGKGVTNYVYDPYARPEGVEEAVEKIHGGQADTATLSNVLNVIKEKGARRRVLQQANDAVKDGGEIYITVYYDRSKKEGPTSKGYQLHRPLKAYKDEISEVLDIDEDASTASMIVAKPRKATALGSGIMFGPESADLFPADEGDAEFAEIMETKGWQAAKKSLPEEGGAGEMRLSMSLGEVIDLIPKDTKSRYLGSLLILRNGMSPSGRKDFDKTRVVWHAIKPEEELTPSEQRRIEEWEPEDRPQAGRSRLHKFKTQTGGPEFGLRGTAATGPQGQISITTSLPFGRHFTPAQAWGMSLTHESGHAASMIKLYEAGVSKTSGGPSRKRQALDNWVYAEGTDGGRAVTEGKLPPNDTEIRDLLPVNYISRGRFKDPEAVAKVPAPIRDLFKLYHWVKPQIEEELRMHPDVFHRGLAADRKLGYAADSIEEFIADAWSNPHFQDFLRKLPASPDKSVFQEFIDIIKRLLLGDKASESANTALEEVLDLTIQIANLRAKPQPKKLTKAEVRQKAISEGTVGLGSGIMVDTAEDLSAVDAPLDISALDIKPAARFRTATGKGASDRAEDSTFENYARQKSYVLNAPTVAGYQIFKGRKNRKGRAVEARGEDTAAYRELKYLNDRYKAAFSDTKVTTPVISEIKSARKVTDAFVTRIAKKLYVAPAKAKAGQIPYTGDEAQMEVVRGLIEFVRDPDTPTTLAAAKKWKSDFKNDLFDKMRPLADEVYESVHKGMVENLVHLHDTMHPEIRERAKLWYEGANRIAQDFATRYNITTGQAAATIAVLSPQKDWFQNVSLAGRVMEVVSKQQETVFDKEMADAFIEMSQNIPKTGLTAAAHAKKKAQAKKSAEAMVVIMEGKTLAQLIEEAASFEPEPQKKGESDKAFKKRRNAELARMRPLPARFVRTFDYLNHPRGYAIITPEGNRVQLQRTKNGEIAKVGWGSYPEIQKAVDSFLTDDPEVHSDLLGNQHKVRNFRNNIADPTNIMDGTVDTHAVGAALMLPVAGGSDEVTHNFGGTGISSSGNAELGMMGVYAMFLRAHQDAAAFINGRDGTNLSTREIQSITWEQVRTLFTAEQKREAASYAKKGVEETVLDESRKIWNKTNDDGEARNLIEERFGGYGLPDWATPVERSLVARDKSYTESVRLKRLPDAGVSRSPDARAGGDPDGAGAGAVEVDNLPPDPEGLSTDLPSAIGLSGFPADPSFLKPISSILPDPTVKELRAINKEYMSVLNEAKESMGSKAFMELVEKHLAYDEQSALIMAMKPWGSKVEYEIEEDKPAPEINSLKGQEIRNKLRPMVDAAARAAGWKIGVAYHGTDRVLTIFDPKKTGSDIVSTSTATNLTFFTPDVDSAREFGQNKVNHNVVESGKLAPPRSLEIIPVYLKVDKLFDPRKDWEKYSDLLYENRPNKDTEFKITDEVIDRRATPIEEWIKKNKGNLANGHWNFWENQQVVDAVLSEYDGMLISENGVATDVDGNFPVLDDNDMNIAVRDSRLIKSAAPVTLDEDFNLIPLEARFNPADERYIFSGVFGDESDLPSEFDADKVDYGNFIELLELPVAGAGSGFKLVKRQFAKMFVGETDPTVQKYARQRDAFLRTTEKMVEEYHDKYTAAIDKYYSSPDDVPWDLIQAAVGTLDNIDPDPDNDLQQAHIKRLDEIKARSRVVMSQEIEDAENQFAKDKENIAFIVREMRADGNQTPEEIRKLGSESRKRIKEAKDRLNKRINEARKRADARKGAETEIEEQSFKETLEKSRMANKQVVLGGRDAALSELADTAPDLFTVIVDLRRLTDELSAKARDLFGRGGHDVIAKFDNNMGLYITRRYQMFSDSGYVKRILTSKEEKDVAVREAAIEFMRGQWIENKTDELMRDNAGNREFTLQDAKDESYRLYTKSSNGGASLGFQMAAEFLNSWRGQGELTEAQDFASAFELAGMPKTVAPRMSGGLKAIVKNLKERSDIPKPLADLMGANNLPESSIDNLLYSFGTVAKIAAHQSFLEKMKQAGTQAETPWLLTADQYNKALGENYSEFIEYKKILSTSADSGLNPLAGMYVHPDIYNSIRPMFQQTPRSGDDASSQLLHGSMRAAQLATGSAMGFKTLFSVGFFLRNMLGNVLFFGPAQGYWKAGKDIWSGDVGEGRGMSAWQGVRRALKGNKAATNAYLRELEGLDVFGNEVRSQIMLRLINGEETFDGVQEQIVNLQKKLSDKNLIKQGGAKYTSMMNTLARLASAMDSFYKIGYYENELAILRKAQEADRLLPPDQQTYANMSDLELKQEAAEIIGDTAQSYSRALPIIKKISGSGWGLVFAPFIRFTAEVPRIVVNTYKRGFRDIRSKNPVMRRRGYNRVLSMTAIAGGLSMAVPTLLRSLLSEMGEDEDEAFRMSLPPYLRNHTFWLWKTDDGEIGSLDLTYLNPFSIIVDPLLRGMEHMVRGEPFTAVEKMTTAAILQPYLGEQILAGSIIDVMENRNAKTNMPIVESSQPLHIRMLNKLKYVGREAYGPRTPLKAIEAIKAGFGDAPESFADSPFGIVVYDSLPVRPRFYKPEDQFSRVVYQLRDEHRRAGRAFNELLTPKGMTEGAVEAVHKSVLSDRKRVNQKLMQAMRGMKGLGMTNQSIYGAMTAARYGDRRSKLLFAGFMENPVPTKNVTESLMRTAQGQQRLRTLMRAHGERERFLTVER